MLEQMENIIFILLKQFSVRRASFFFPTNQRASQKRKIEDFTRKEGKGKISVPFPP